MCFFASTLWVFGVVGRANDGVFIRGGREGKRLCLYSCHWWVQPLGRKLAYFQNRSAVITLAFLGEHRGVRWVVAGWSFFSGSSGLPDFLIASTDVDNEMGGEADPDRCGG